MIAFRRICILEKRTAIEKPAIKYALGDSGESHWEATAHEWASPCVPEISIDYLSEKEAIELVKTVRQARQQWPTGRFKTAAGLAGLPLSGRFS